MAPHPAAPRTLDLPLAGPGASPEAGAARSPRAPEPSSPPLILRRLSAGLADLALLFAVLGSLVGGAAVQGVPLARAPWPAFGLMLLVFSYLYTVIPLAFWGRTPGMALARLRARCWSGENLSFGQSGRRWLGALIAAALLGLPLLLALTGRSLGDRLSRSGLAVVPQPER